jgi:hypothetical protein
MSRPPNAALFVYSRNIIYFGFADLRRTALNPQKTRRVNDNEKEKAKKKDERKQQRLDPGPQTS